MRRLLVSVVLVVTAVGAGALPGCGHARPLRIGSVYPRTGPQGEGGREEARGVALAAQWANEHGGVRGRRVQLIDADAPSAESVPGALAGLERAQVRIVVGSHGSTMSTIAADTAARDGLLLWETGAVGLLGAGATPGRTFFRLAPMGANLGGAAIAFIRGQVSGKLPVDRSLRYSVAYADDAYGRAVGGGAIDEIARTGEMLAGRFPYDPRAARIDQIAGQIATQIAAARTDVLFVAAYLDDGTALRRATVSQHVPLLASIGTSSSYCMPDFGARLGADAVGLFASDKPDGSDIKLAALRPDARRAFRWADARYRARYREPLPAAALGGFANAYALFAQVLPRARRGTVDAVARAALAVKLPPGALPNGAGLDLVPPGERDAGENRAAASVIWEWIAPRTRAVVWPPTFASHPVTVIPLAR